MRETSAELRGRLPGVSDAVESGVARLGRLLSWPTHPLFVGTPVSIAVGVRLFGGWNADVWQLIALVGSLGLLIPLGSLFALQRAGKIADVFMTRHEDRRWLYPIGVVDLAVIYGAFAAYEAPREILAVVAAGILAVAGMMIANRFLKASLHAAGNAGIATALCWVEGLAFWPAWILVALACWARLACKGHSPAEIATGLAVGTLPTALAMGWFLGGLHW